MEINNHMVKKKIIFCFTATDNSSPKLINLFTACLTDTLVRVLSKGLKFITTPKRNTVIPKKYQKCINLKLFRKPYKFKTVNILKYMNLRFNFTTSYCRSNLS